MNFSKEGRSLEEIKEPDIVDYLAKLGHHPTKIRNGDHWYLSPFRNEKTPSFKVNRKINSWYDRGMGKGGNSIDFGMLCYRCTLAEFIQKMDAGFSFHQPLVFPSKQPEQEQKITILEDLSLRPFPLLKYLRQRKIPLNIADHFCREFRYDLNGKIFYGIGFKNDPGGYEIHDPYFKANSAPKDVTTFNYGGKEVRVFEGFIDFLSFMVINQNKPKVVTDFLVLNYVSFFERARPFREQHEAVLLDPDNDTTGQNFRQYALSLSSKYKDANNLYFNHKDLNVWLVDSGSNPRKRLRARLG